MKTIGLIGGMSWESSAEYYRLLNELTKQSLGGLHSAKCVLYSVDFAEIEVMQKSGAWHEAGTALANAAVALENAGCDMVLTCTNTMHLVAQQVADAISIPLLDIRDVTIQAVRDTGLTHVGLLATRYTMEHPFYREYLEQAGLKLDVPGDDDRPEVNRIIFEELFLGSVLDTSRASYLRVIDDLVSRGCEGIILGCTEIELLIGSDHTDVPLFPTTRLHVEAALAY